MKVKAVSNKVKKELLFFKPFNSNKSNFKLSKNYLLKCINNLKMDCQPIDLRISKNLSYSHLLKIVA